MFGKKHCYNGGNLHKFEGRYSKDYDPRELTFAEVDNCLMSEMIYLKEANAKQTIKYEGDICIWCGKRIDK